MRALLLLLAFALPAAAQDFAAPRPFAVLEGAVVRLDDIFEGAGARGATPLGPAPAPGQRLVIEAPQLLAIARQYGLAWRSMSGTERVVLERAGRAVPREEVLDLLRAALRGQGLDDDSELELQAYSPPMVPPNAILQMAVEQASLEAATQRFLATVAVAAEGMATVRLRLAGRAVATQPMLVAMRRLGIGDVVAPGDVRVIRIPASRLRPGAAERPDQAVGQALRRPTAQGQPLLVANLAPPLAVERGATVTLLYEIPGMTLTAQGRAMEGAARGAMVSVMNLTSRVVVEARVIGPGRVRVEAPR